MAETNTALESNYNPIKNKFKDGSDIKQQQQQKKKKNKLYFYKISQFAVERMKSGNARVKVLTGKRLLYLFS